MRQGDPLSPLLFVFASQLLQYAINDVWQYGMVDSPLDDSYEIDCPIIQYADDTLIIIPASPRHSSKI